MLRLVRPGFYFLLFLFATLPVFSQTTPESTIVSITDPPASPITRTQDGQITIRATRLEQPLTLDGSLQEDIYRTTPAANHFIQQFPRGGEPATDDTDVWIFFDSRNVYVSVRCWDSHPQQMVADEMRRDNQNIWLNDNIIVVLDTFLDRRSAFFFQTNPIGGVRDALVIDETTTNYDWNTVWDVKSRKFEAGWTAEMAIPFKSLRYKPTTEPQSWGMNVMRVVRARNEQTLLSRVPATYGGQGVFRLASAATVVGVGVPEASRNIEVKPYAISNLTTNLPAGIRNHFDGDFGLDAKYGLTSSLTFDLTYNTDFAQVEIDEQQVNLTRFSLFFPEKRDFFLEGQGVFDFGGSGARRSGTADDTPILFFSRRIGLNAGRPVPIQAGGRLMGRMGRLSLGMLNIQTGAADEADAVSTNFSVMRVKRDILRRSSIGLLMTNRSPSGPGSGSNQVYGTDATLAFFENIRLNGYYARSATTGRSGNPESYRGQLQYAADKYGFEAERLKVGDAFNPEVGFLRRQDFRRTFALGRFSPRPRSLPGVRKLTWEASVARYVNSADVLETQQHKGSFRVEFHSSDQLSFDFLRNYEMVSKPFRLASGAEVPVGQYRFQELATTYTIGPQRRVSGAVNLNRGAFYGGHRTQIGFSGRSKFSAQFAIEPRVSMDWVRLPQATFRVTLVGARPTFTITPRMFASALLQYNSSTNSLETNVRWRWEYQPGSDLFIVYTDGRDTSASGFPALLNRGIAVKFTRFLRF
jgi:hypothetical protein